MKRFTKMLCMLLALVMLVGTLPLSILADGAQTAHTVKFNLNYNGAHQIPAQTVEHGQCATQPGNVTREGWIFQYWYVKTGDGIQKFDLTQPVTEDMTLYARWDEDINYWGPIWGRNLQAAADAGKAHGNTYTVTFDPNGTDVVGMPAAQRVKEGGYATEPAEPERLVYSFGGWFTDSECTQKFDFRTQIKADITLYAKWDASIYAAPIVSNHIRTGTMEIEGTPCSVQYIDNELVVVVLDGTSKETLEKIATPLSGNIVGQIPKVGHYQIAFGENHYTIAELETLADTISASGVTEEVYVNLVMDVHGRGRTYTNAWYPNDTYIFDDAETEEEQFVFSWNNKTGKTWGLLAGRVPQAWLLSKQYGENRRINVGILDAGFSKHKDLSITYIDYETDRPKTEIDHGTHVAGILAAKSDNKTGVAGICQNANVYGIGKSIYTHFTWNVYFSTLIELKCNVINMSIGYIDPKKGLDDETKKVVKKVSKESARVFKKYIKQGYDFLVVTVAGNAGLVKHDVNYENAITKLDDPLYKKHILVVGNVQKNDTVLSRNVSSSYVGNRVDIMAPGTYIYSTLSGNTYGNATGTSMASPFVAGVAGLIKETVGDALRMTEIREIILDTADIPVQDSDVNMINAEAAMREALRRVGHTTVKKKDDRTVEFSFIDKATNQPLGAETIHVSYDLYAGANNFTPDNDWNDDWHLTSSGTQTIYLEEGVWLMTFSNDKYATGVYVEITPSTNKVTIYMTPDGETPPLPAETKTMRIRFVDSDTKKVLKISEVIPDNFALLSIGHTSQASDFLYSYINPPKGFTIENGTDFVFPEIPVITAPGNYIFKIKYNSDTYFLPGYYGDYTIDSFKTSSSAAEWSIDVPVMQKKLIVGDVCVTPDNAADILGDGTAKYDYTTNTLTLTNATITAYDVIYAQLDSLHVVIPENTTTILHSLLEHNDDWGDMEGDVISQIGGLYISGGGTLSMRGSKGLTKFGRDVTTRFCAFADYIRMDNITIEVDEYIDGGFYCEPGDIELKNTHITFSSLNYNLLFSCGDITISDSVINCLSGEYLSIHAHYKTFITNSTLTLNALTPHIDCDDLSVYNSVVHIKNAKEIHMEGRSAITLTGVKIVTPANGIIYNNGETYYIANPDGSYPTEILIR